MEGGLALHRRGGGASRHSGPCLGSHGPRAEGHTWEARGNTLGQGELIGELTTANLNSQAVDALCPVYFWFVCLV